VEDLVLISGTELGETLLERAPAIIVGAVNADPIELRRRELELIALLLGPVPPRALHVPCLSAAERSGHLLVDEKGDAGLLGPWSEVVGRNQATHRGVEKSDFRLPEIGEDSRRDRDWQQPFALRVCRAWDEPGNDCRRTRCGGRFKHVSAC
jgi:hypothetical protein